LIEIRTIRKSEAEPFLELLCSVFGLDVSRARQVFFKEPLFDLARKWALFEDGRIASILTTTPLEFGFGRAFGVAGVATDPAAQRRGLAQRLIEHVLAHGAEIGEPGCLLFAHREEVYRRCGFETVDMVVRGPILVAELSPVPDTVPFARVKEHYDAWAATDHRRLLRNERRWKYWKWIPRTCEAAPGGYVCVEPHLCREALVTPSLEKWPVMPGTSWLGLESMTKALSVPLVSSEKELFVMAYKVPHQVQMYMTDQF
jgi:predicted N-acetyltransferase YhbS